MPVTDETAVSARPAHYVPVQRAGPDHTGRRPDTGRRTVLLTGASGVVGRALLPRLGDLDVVCLVHRSPVSGPNVTTVPGDIAKPMLGLAEQAYAELAAKVDAVIHCAAITDFNRTDGSLEATNVAGTAHVAAFAGGGGEARAVPRQHRVRAHHGGRRPRPHRRRLRRVEVGGRTGRAVQRRCRTSSCGRRSSSATRAPARSAAFQGLHQVVAGLFAGIVPMIPFDPAWPIDFIPADVVADAIACVVENRVSEGEFWISAGEKALRLDEGVAVGRRARPRPGRAASTCRGSCRRRCSTG